MSAKKKNKLAIFLTVVLVLAIAVLGLLKIPGLWMEEIGRASCRERV